VRFYQRYPRLGEQHDIKKVTPKKSRIFSNLCYLPPSHPCEKSWPTYLENQLHKKEFILSFYDIF
jgi:hypothetical protein